MKINVLFLCTGNTCRSPMAEQLFRHFEPNEDVVSTSAGLFAREGQGMNADAIIALTELGVQVLPHKSKPLTSDLLAKTDIAVCMTEEHRTFLTSSPEFAKVLSDGKRRIIGTVKELVGIDAGDPYGLGIEAYRRSAETLKKACKPLAEAIKKFSEENK